MWRVTRGLSPLVGRESEVGLLLERWEHVEIWSRASGAFKRRCWHREVRLVQILKDHVANEPHIRWECRSSSYFHNTALFPMTDLFQRLLQFETGDTPDEKSGKLEQMLSQYRLPLEETLPVFAPLLSLPLPEDRYTPLGSRPNINAKRPSKPSSRSSWNWLNINRFSLSWKTCTGQTPQPSNCCTWCSIRPQQPHLVRADLPSHISNLRWHHRSYLTEMTVNRLSHTSG